MRLGVFGGTFDPPHRGHVAIAQAAADAFSLEQILWVPVGRQPLKPASTTAYEDRVAMVRLACALDIRFVASEIDAPCVDGLPNYTVDTLRRVHTEWPRAKVFALVGMDALFDMPRWREAERLPELAEWVAVTRPGYHSNPENLPVHLLQTVQDSVSASEVRHLLQLGMDCSGMVPKAVLAYIEQTGLYGWPRR